MTSAAGADSPNEEVGGSPDSGDTQPAVLDAITVPDELVEIVRDPNADTERVRSALAFFAASFWQGPLPRPEALAAYNNAYPDCAREIVGMAKSQSQHRQQVETKVIDADIELRRRGQHYGFAIAMTVILGGLVVIAMGRSLAGFGTVLVGLVSLVGLFVYSRRRASHELEEKRKGLEQPPVDPDAYGEDRGRAGVVAPP